MITWYHDLMDAADVVAFPEILFPVKSIRGLPVTAESVDGDLFPESSWSFALGDLSQILVQLTCNAVDFSLYLI